jgi:hypothetical protein
VVSDAIVAMVGFVSGVKLMVMAYVVVLKLLDS